MIVIGTCKCGKYGQVFNEKAEAKIGVCHRDIDKDGIFGHWVTAKLKNKADCRQGIVVNIDPLVIRGESGKEYECEGEPTLLEAGVCNGDSQHG